MILTKKQQEAVQIGRDRYRSGEKPTIIAGYGGSGKAQPNDTLIPTPNGKIKLGELNVGDYVYDRKGRPTKIIGVFPQGKKRNYKVVFSDGRETYCNDEHLWSYYTSEGNLHTKTLREMMNEGLTTACGNKYKIPVNKPVEMDKQKLPIDPYVLGTFIGGECRLQEELTLSFDNSEIPSKYINSTIEDRLSLLQGLMDTSGSVSSDGVRYSSVSKNIIEGLREILWSLGYENILQCDYSDKYTTGACYSLTLKIPNSEKHKLFRLKSKKDIALSVKDAGDQGDYNKISIVEVIDTHSEVEMTCISVDNEEQLYLTNDYIVTHNTSTLKYILSEIGVKSKDIAYATYTGKAALVLRQKGHNAHTLHKLLYDTLKIEDKETGKVKFKFSAKKKLDKPYKIIVVDELSMVPFEMMQLLFKYPVHIIGLGDPGQLPPLYNDNKLLQNPHIFLDEVMRQSADSEILKLGMDVRSGKALELFDGTDVKVIDRKDVVDGMYLWADTIICGRNQERREINHKVRCMRGAKSIYPEVGDKLLCLRNYWDSESDVSLDPMINGMVGYATEVRNMSEVTGDIPLYFQPEYLPDGDGFDIDVDYNIFNWQEPRQGNILYNKKVIEPGINMDYGYAITCWKAQGSEYDNVLFFANKPGNLSREDYIKYLYTGITRAKRKLIVVRN